MHTGRPFGPGGDKTIAYETYVQLDRRVPGTVFVPMAHAERCYGVWKGFRELDALGVADGTPAMVACEPSVRGPLGEAIARDVDRAEVSPEPTAANSIGATRSTLRARRAIRESGGTAVGVTEPAFVSTGERLAREGFWQETSGTASVAGVRTALEDCRDVEAPVVCLATSSGFKGGDAWTAPEVDGNRSSVLTAIDDASDLAL